MHRRKEANFTGDANDEKKSVFFSYIQCLFLKFDEKSEKIHCFNDTIGSNTLKIAFFQMTFESHLILNSLFGKTLWCARRFPFNFPTFIIISVIFNINDVTVTNWNLSLFFFFTSRWSSYVFSYTKISSPLIHAGMSVFCSRKATFKIDWNLNIFEWKFLFRCINYFLLLYIFFFFHVFRIIFSQISLKQLVRLSRWPIYKSIKIKTFSKLTRVVKVENLYEWYFQVAEKI